MQNAKDIVRQLRQYRLAHSLSQQDMYMKIGMSQQQYQRVEAGQDVRLSTLLRILEGLGLTLMLVPNQMVNTVEKILTEENDSTEKKLPTHDPASEWPAFLKKLGDEN